MHYYNDFCSIAYNVDKPAPKTIKSTATSKFHNNCNVNNERQISGVKAVRGGTVKKNRPLVNKGWNQTLYYFSTLFLAFFNLKTVIAKKIKSQPRYINYLKSGNPSKPKLNNSVPRVKVVPATVTKGQFLKDNNISEKGMFNIFLI